MHQVQWELLSAVVYKLIIDIFVLPHFRVVTFLEGQ